MKELKWRKFSQGEYANIGKLTIYKLTDCEHYSFAYDNMWGDGLYDSVEACKLAAKMDDCKGNLRDLWHKLNPVLPTDNIRYISVEDLKLLH